MKKRKYASGSLLGTSTANSFGFNRTPAEKAVYGDPTQDPLQRVVGDITGNNIKSAINDMYGNLNTNVAPIDNNTLMDRLYNTPRYQKMDRVYNGDIIAGLGLVGSGTLPVAAGFRYGKGAKNGVLSVDWDNMMAAGQGAMNGSSYGPYGIAAGAILGGLSNYVSQLGINKRVDKWNNAVDTYNLAQNSITDQLINNSRLSQMNQYNSNYAKLGGPLNTHGGDFQNGVVEIANGGTHEENPYEGVPMGMDQKGVPNLVEEGEYIWNDYVFSKRIDVPEDMRKKYKFGGKLSFADAVDKVQKESEERPNDPISKRGLNAILSELAMSQEIERQKQQQQEAFENAENLASTFADGGNIHINKNKRGTFTAAATKHNMGVQEFARHVLANKDKYSSTMVKKANFAHNAAGWKHALGGNLFKEGSKIDKPPYYYDTNDYFNTLELYPESFINENLVVPEENVAPMTLPEVIISPENNYNYTGKSTPFARANLRTGYDFSRYLPNTYFTNQAWERTFTRPESRPLSNLENEAKKATIEPSGYVNPDGTLNVAKAAAESANNNKRIPYNERFRYAPLAGALGALLNDLRPIDYSNADRVGNATRSINRYRGYDPLSGYMEYRPVDINALTARMNAQQAADRRALLNMSNGNPAAAALMALATRYNDSRGDLLSKVDEINTARRNAVSGFDMDIKKANRQLGMNAQQMNQNAEQMYLTGIAQEAAMRNALEAAQSGAVSNDYHSIFDSLGGIGKENAEMNMIYEMGMPFYYQDADGNRHIVYRNNQRKCGGKLFKVKK